MDLLLNTAYPLEVVLNEQNKTRSSLISYSSMPDIKAATEVCSAVPFHGSLCRSVSEHEMPQEMISTDLNGQILRSCAHDCVTLQCDYTKGVLERDGHVKVSSRMNITEKTAEMQDDLTASKLKLFDETDAVRTLDGKTMKSVESFHIIFNESCSENRETASVEVGLGCKPHFDDEDVQEEHVIIDVEGRAVETPEIGESKTEEIEAEEKSKTRSNGSSRLSTASSLSTELYCRICHCNDEDEKLITPCNCAGSLRHIHESCLITWMKSKMMDNCELCQENIQITRKVKPIWRWQRPRQRPYPLIFLLTFVGYIALYATSVAKDASTHCISTHCVVFYIVGCLGAILATVFTVYFAKRAREFVRNWARINEDWVVSDWSSGQVSKTKPPSGDNEHKNQLMPSFGDLTTRV